jgi:hypothetical protein
LRAQSLAPLQLPILHWIENRYTDLKMVSSTFDG